MLNTFNILKSANFIAIFKKVFIRCITNVSKTVMENIKIQHISGYKQNRMSGINVKIAELFL